EALTPTAVTSILRRPGTVAYGAWEHDDPTSPVGFAIAVRRADEGVLRFIGVHEDSRRLGVGRALLGAIVSALGEAVGTAPSLPGPLRPVAIRIHDPEPVQVFFRKVGAEIVRVRMDLVRGA
ncbi:MAG: GNAT family N-acetyltransferase, partial [Proteobacteria bacterium]|nr:GNAT family N-acetyltransferase [Pseudomonadota bacterium]